MSKIKFIHSELSKKDKLNLLMPLITNGSTNVKTLIKQVEVSDDEVNSANIASDDFKKIANSRIFKQLSPIFASMMIETIHSTSVIRATELFSYVPANLSIAETCHYSKKDGQILVVHQNGFKSGMVAGSNFLTLGMSDDVAAYRNDNTYRIEKRLGDFSVGSLYKTSIADNYTVTTRFKINRFPAKVHTNLQPLQSNGEFNLISKQYGSRRSDVISFNYEGENNSIEFGAMAPWLYKDGVSVYKGEYEPYSICASIYMKGQKYSVYTDYKFNLGETNIVSLNISKVPSLAYNEYLDYAKSFDAAYTAYINSLGGKGKYGDAAESMGFTFNDKVYGSLSGLRYLNYLNRTVNNGGFYFGGLGKYQISLVVNGFNEPIAEFWGKCWNNDMIDSKRNNMIASSPGFMPRRIETVKSYKLYVTCTENFKWSDVETPFMNYGIRWTFNSSAAIGGKEYTIASKLNEGEKDYLIREYADKGFLFRFVLESSVTKPCVESSLVKTPILNNFNFDTLNSISTPPGDKKVNSLPNPVQIYKRYNYRMNNGIDYGAINIYSDIEEIVKSAKK